MQSNPSSESAAVPTTPKNLLQSMLCTWNQVYGEAARWLSGTHRAVAPYIGSEQPTVDGLPDTPSSTPRYTRKFHDDSIPRSTSQSTHQVININDKDPDRPARSATFPFLVIEDIVAFQALRKPEGVEATTSYCDVEKLLLDSAGQVHPLRRRRISQNVQYRHACDVVVRPLQIIGDVDYSEETDELVYTVASNVIGWDVILNFLTALAGAARTVGHADTQTRSRPGSQPHQGHRLHSMEHAHTHSPGSLTFASLTVMPWSRQNLRRCGLQRREFCCPLTLSSAESLESVHMVPARIGQAIYSCVMTGLRDECLKQTRYNLEPWNLGKGPIDWDINSPWNNMDISTLLHTYNKWILLPVVPTTFAGGNDGLRHVMLRWHSAGAEDTNAGHCFHQKKSYVFINLGTTTFNFASKNPTWPQFSRSSPPTCTGMPAVFIHADEPPASIESTPQPRATNNGPNNFNGGFGEGRQWPGYHVTDTQWTLWPEKPQYPPPIAWDAMAGQRIAECLGSPALECFQLFDGVMLDRLVDFAAAAAAEAARPHPRADDADQSRPDCSNGGGDFPNARGTQGASGAGDLGGLQDDGRCGDVPGTADAGAGDVLGAKEFSGPDDVFDRTCSQGHSECVRDGPGNAPDAVALSEQGCALLLTIMLLASRYQEAGRGRTSSRRTRILPGRVFVGDICEGGCLTYEPWNRRLDNLRDDDSGMIPPIMKKQKLSRP